jgi:hypothetical protein
LDLGFISAYGDTKNFFCKESNGPYENLLPFYPALIPSLASVSKGLSFNARARQSFSERGLGMAPLWVPVAPVASTF